MRQIGDQAAALVFANPVRTRSNDTTYAYRPSSDLWYLTGCEEPDAACLLLPGHDEHPFVLFVRPRDFSREVWDGPRLGLEGAHEVLGADKAFAVASPRSSCVWTLTIARTPTSSTIAPMISA